MATPKGQYFFWYIADRTSTGTNDQSNLQKVGKTTSKELTRTKDTLSVVTDDNPDHGTYIGGLKEAEFTAEALYDPDTSTYDMLEAAYKADDATVMALRGSEDTDVAFTFSGHVTELPLTAELNEPMTVSTTVQVDGPVTKETVADIGTTT